MTITLKDVYMLLVLLVVGEAVTFKDIALRILGSIVGPICILYINKDYMYFIYVVWICSFWGIDILYVIWVIPWYNKYMHEHMSFIRVARFYFWQNQKTCLIRNSCHCCFILKGSFDIHGVMQYFLIYIGSWLRQPTRVVDRLVDAQLCWWFGGHTRGCFWDKQK